MYFSFRIKLPDDAKIRYSVFYTNLLERADPSTLLQETFHHENDDTAEYKVERVVAHKLKNFLIKWKDYKDKDNTWEPVKNLKNCQQKIDDYHNATELRT